MYALCVFVIVFFSSRRRHTRCALVTGVQTCALPILVGTNVRWEASLVNTRIRKALKRKAKVFAIGPEVDLTYKATWLGDDLGLLSRLPAEVDRKSVV